MPVYAKKSSLEQGLKRKGSTSPLDNTTRLLLRKSESLTQPSMKILDSLISSLVKDSGNSTRTLFLGERQCLFRGMTFLIEERLL